MVLLSAIDLRQGICKNSQYEAFKFPGGEIKVKLTQQVIDYINLQRLPDIHIKANLVSSDDLMLLALMADTIHKTWDTRIHVLIPYMAYQQDDRDFGDGECFGLVTIVKMLNTLPVYKYTIFDPHSEVSPALLGFLKRCKVVTNYEYIFNVFNMLNPNVARTLQTDYGWYSSELQNTLTLMSPDAGAYKKIFKLAEALKFDGTIECANKYRSSKDGELKTHISTPDFGGKDILIIDDICLGGRTFVELARQIKDRNVGKMYLAVSHGIFNQLNGNLNGLGLLFNKIFTTNSVRDDYKQVADSIDYMNGEKTCSFKVYNQIQ